MPNIRSHKVELIDNFTEQFGSKKDEEEYIAWLKTVQAKMRQPMPYHNSVEEVYEDI